MTHPGRDSHDPRVSQWKPDASDQFHLREGTVRVIRLYEAWGKTEKATKWKTKLEMPDLPEEVFARAELAYQ
jgi:hypothetical protein